MPAAPGHWTGKNQFRKSRSFPSSASEPQLNEAALLSFSNYSNSFVLPSGKFGTKPVPNSLPDCRAGARSYCWRK
jgi:hypothetical protein